MKSSDTSKDEKEVNSFATPKPKPHQRKNWVSRTAFKTESRNTHDRKPRFYSSRKNEDHKPRYDSNRQNTSRRDRFDRNENDFFARKPRLPQRSELPPKLYPIFDRIITIGTDFHLDLKQERNTENVCDFNIIQKMKDLMILLLCMLREIEMTHRLKESYLQLIYWMSCWFKAYCVDEMVVSSGHERFLFQVIECLRRHKNRSCFRVSPFMRNIIHGFKIERQNAIKVEQRVRNQKAGVKNKMLEEKVFEKKTSNYRDLDSKIIQLYESIQPLEEDEICLKTVESELEKEVNDIFPCSLKRFGSSANGLGARGNSDIDLCILDFDMERVTSLFDNISIQDDQAQDNLNKGEDDEDENNAENVPENTEIKLETKLIRILAEGLAKSSKFKLTKMVDMARVPIVTVEHIVHEVPCDICVGNTLPVYNTEMLRAYAEYDKRVKPLIFVVKAWAKSRQIADASSGTISSYAWVLLVIFFLQQTKEVHFNGFPKKRSRGKRGKQREKNENDAGENPGAKPSKYANVLPILPCLQRQKRRGRKEVIKIRYNDEDNVEFDVFFRRDTENVRSEVATAREKSHDDSTVGELFARFLFFYGYHLNMQAFIISVRSGELINKQGHHFSRNQGLCIEDPFELERDLGSSIRGKLGDELILKEFRRGFSMIYDGKVDSLNDTICKTQELPSELKRVCFSCHESDHESRECPLKEVVERNGCLFCGDKAHRIRDCSVNDLNIDIKENVDKHMEQNDGRKDKQMSVKTQNRKVGRNDNDNDKNNTRSVKDRNSNKSDIQQKQQKKRLSSKGKDVQTPKPRSNRAQKMCRQYLMGKCDYGDKCKFQH